MKKLSLLLAFVFGTFFSLQARQPNIVVILSDDYGWGSSGCYGAPSALHTPNLDRLAREGRRFTQAYAPGSVCSPSRYGMMTGRYYWRTKVKDGMVLPANAPLHIETNRTTMASVCKSAGYTTAAFGKWHLGMTTHRITDWQGPLVPGPLRVGFDHYFGMAANIGNSPHSFIIDEEVSGHIPGEPIIVQGTKGSITTSGIRKAWQPDHIVETLTGKVCEWIEANKAKPFFLYYAPNAVHEPIVPNPRFTGSRYGKYGDFIEELDWSVGQVLDELDKLKLTQDTLLIFTSDNGGVVQEGNMDCQTAMKAGLKINGDLKGGKHSEWEGGFREPFLVRWPGHVPANTVSEQVICLTDMVATFAKLVNVPLTKGNAEDSFDVIRAFTEEKTGAPVRDFVVLQSATATYDIRQGDWKLVERANPPSYEAGTRNKKKAEAQERRRKKAAQLQDELYNLKDDPAETKTVAKTHPHITDKLKKLLVESRDRGYTRPGAGE